MQVKPEALERHLAGGLQPAFLVAGDETLLVEEAVGAILAAAEAQGFTERDVLFAESGFDWSTLLEAGASMSLFAERKVIDLRLTGGKVDRSGSDALRRYLEAPPEDNLLLLRAPRLDRSQRNSAWFKALDAAGCVVLIWGLDRDRWPAWLQQRLRRHGVNLEADAFEAFSRMVEGNLLAAVQEIEKLSLSGLEQPISLSALESAMEDASSFDGFELIDAVLAGDAPRTSRIVGVLRGAGVSPFAVLGPFVGQLRQIGGGGGWMPRDRAAAAQRFQRRVGRIDRVLAECALVDQQAKGQLHGDAWLSLERLLLRLCGVRPLALLGELQEAARRR